MVESLSVLCYFGGYFGERRGGGWDTFDCAQSLFPTLCSGFTVSTCDTVCGAIIETEMPACTKVSYIGICLQLSVLLYGKNYNNNNNKTVSLTWP